MAIDIKNLTDAFSTAAKTVNEMNKTSHIELVNVDDIITAEFNPYSDNDDEESVCQLAASIEAYGLINPLCVNLTENSRYRLISGERRFKAVKSLGWKRVSCVVYDGLEAAQAELRLHEANLEAREYTSAQKFMFYKRVKELLEQLQNDDKLTGGLQKNIAKMLHVSQRQVRKYESIDKLSEDIQAKVTAGEISINQAYEASRLAKQSEDNHEKTGIESKSPNHQESQKSDFYELKVQSNLSQIEWTKMLENAILAYYDTTKLVSYYKSFIPTTAEATKQILKPQNGFSGLSNHSADITLTNNYFRVAAGASSRVFKYSEVDACVRDMIRSKRIKG